MTTELTETIANTVPKARKRRRPSVVGGIAFGVLALFVVLAVVGPWVAPYPPTQLAVGARLLGPTPQFLFGTDALGRDQLSRVLVAIGPAVAAAVMATIFSLVVGTALGLIAGFWGGRIDGLISRVVDFLFAIPEYLLAILVLAILGRGLANAAVAIGIVFIPRFARTVRSATQEVMTRNYISAARLSGHGNAWIILRHVLPNIASPLIVIAAINLSMSSGAYAALSFLGFGVRPPQPDFGSMISDSLQYIGSAPWLVAPPAIVFVIFILAINIAGDALRDLLDPKTVNG
ncbi:ABC transporter permease [Microbacterium capsulatum]|uniref:ABC transporter permease n=1 Tax=Microbacterium capsulatum TaxID=3041921 RepID=A0ABU0XI46_9MICO|nr:ABC transporter permease [Microbacterium sp. ASV81]MDQ4214537.1 ABC transporter permease [Microbacterium sp. ASV81]